MSRRLVPFHTISFKHAWDGIVDTFYHQPNLRVHFTFTILIILMGLYFRINRFEWIIILFTVMWVIVSEMINSTVESITDLITTEYRVQIKRAKDVSAGMVLIGATGSVIVGVVIFLPYILAKIG